MPYCAKCGKEHAEEDNYCSRFGASLKDRGDAVTEVVDIAYPETENPMLELVIPVSGRLELQPGGEKLVDGTITYDIPEWKPLITEGPDRIQIKRARVDHRQGCLSSDLGERPRGRGPKRRS